LPWLVHFFFGGGGGGGGGFWLRVGMLPGLELAPVSRSGVMLTGLGGGFEAFFPI
jgi:hypothetical protein